MKSEDYNFIFLHGLRVRSGTNYLARFFSKHPDIQLLPIDKTTDEFPLLKTLDNFINAFNQFNKKFNGRIDLFQIKDYLPFFGNSWLRYLVDLMRYKKGHIFIKDPSVVNLDSFFDVFPDAKLIILLRDGRDNVTSSVKASLAIRRSNPILKILKDKINYYSFRSFINSSKEWNEATNKALDFDMKFKNSIFKDQYLLVKYEDVYDDPKYWGTKMFSFCGLEVNEDILKKLEEIEVVGSSFYNRLGQENAVKPNWDPTTANERFKPIGRWKKWGYIKKRTFKYIAGKSLINLGYEKDLNW